MVINGRRLGAHKREIKADLYGIARHIKQIDKSYRVVYDTRLKRFEVWHLGARSITPEVVVPYAELDYRTVNLVRATRVERAEGVINIDSALVRLG